MNNFDFENQKAIPPIFSRTKTVGNLWWLTWQDILWLACVIIISIACSVPAFLSVGTWGFIPLGLINIIGWLLIIKVGGTSFHSILITWLAWLILKRQYSQKELNIINNDKKDNDFTASVEYLNGQKVFLFEIIGTNTANFGDLEISHFQNTIRNFFNNPNSFAIYKIDIPFNFDEFYKKANLIKNETLKQNYLNSIKEKIETRITSEHKTFLVFKNLEFNNIEQIILNLKNSLSSENVDLLPIDDYSKQFLLKEIFLQKYENVEVGFNHLTLTKNNQEKEFVAFLKITQLPNFVNIDWLSELFEQEGFDIAIECSEIPAKECRNMIDEALLTTNSGFNVKRKTSAVDEAITEFQIYALDELKKDFAINQETIKNTSIIFRVTADSLQDLKTEKERLKNFLWNKKMVPNSLLGKQWKALKSWLPIYYKNQESKRYRRKLIKSNFNLPSGTLAFGMPFSINKVVEPKGVIFGDDSNAYPVALNFLETTNKVPNRNIVLIGQSGSGKTSTVVQIVANVLNFGNSKTIIIDPSNEYASNNPKMQDKNLLRYFPNATVIDVNQTQNFRINPFSFWPGQEIKEKIDFISNFFKILFDKILDNRQIQVLVNVCYDFYKKDLDKEFSFSEILEFFEKNKNDDKIISFALKQYCKNSVYGDYWDDKTKLDLSNELIIFNINGLRDDSKIFEAQLYIIMNYLLYSVYNNLKNNDKNLFLVIDEEHKLINSDYPFILNTVVELNKQARKYGGAVLNATQNVKDFIKTSALKENAVNILDNSSTLFCMKLNENDLKGLDELMSEVKPLTDNEKLVLRSQQRGQALLFRGNDKVFVNVWQIF